MSRRSIRRSSIEIVPRTLDDLAHDLDELSERSLKKVIYGGLDDVSASGVRRMRTVFEKHIEGGPARFTKIVPGSRRSSVVDNPARKAKSGRIASSIRVQRLQSRYLRFALGEEDDRYPDDVGAATEYNFVPNENGLAQINMSLTPEGNMRRSTLKGLIRLSKRRTRKTKAGKARRQGPRDGIYFGQSGRRKTMGFWQRSSRDAEKDNRRPKLLVLAIRKSEYDRDRLVRGWSEAVEEAMDELPSSMRKRMAAVLARM